MVMSGFPISIAMTSDVWFYDQHRYDRPDFSDQHRYDK
jgi:hypothetical protein